MNIRPAHREDLEFVIATAQRLGAFGPPAWRPASEVADGEVRTLRAFFERPADGATLLLAESEGEPLGFVFLERHHDYFTQEEHGHVGIIAVAEAAEGRGVATLLMREAEAWARERAYRILTLNVFHGNHHAREVYEHLGYAPETVRYVKVLQEPGRLPWAE